MKHTKCPSLTELITSSTISNSASTSTNANVATMTIEEPPILPETPPPPLAPVPTIDPTKDISCGIAEQIVYSTETTDVGIKDIDGHPVPVDAKQAIAYAIHNDTMANEILLGGVSAALINLSCLIEDLQKEIDSIPQWTSCKLEFKTIKYPNEEEEALGPEVTPVAAAYLIDETATCVHLQIKEKMELLYGKHIVYITCQLDDSFSDSITFIDSDEDKKKEGCFIYGTGKGGIFNAVEQGAIETTSSDKKKLKLVCNPNHAGSYFKLIPQTMFIKYQPIN